jgi:hypothetical protein
MPEPANPKLRPRDISARGKSPARPRAADFGRGVGETTSRIRGKYGEVSFGASNPATGGRDPEFQNQPVFLGSTYLNDSIPCNFRLGYRP